MTTFSLTEEQERLQYLDGVLMADEDFRLNEQADATKIDPFGTGTKAFWRGMLEAGGTVTPHGHTSEHVYPRIELKAAYQILVKFLAFMQEEICTRNGIPWAWDEGEKLEWQAKGRFIRVSGQKAQDIVRVLYLGENVGRSSVRHKADQIVQWTPRNRR